MTDQLYLLPIEETLKTSWDKTSGSKSTFWTAIIIIIAVMIGISGVVYALTNLAPKAGPLFNLIFQVVGYLLQMGLIYIGIKRAQDLPISFGMVFQAFDSGLALKLIALYILQILLFLIPILLIFVSVFLFTASNGMALLGALAFIAGLIGAFCLAVRLGLSMAFVLDANAGPWNAIKYSFRATRCNFWRLVFITLIQSLIILVSAIPFGIGLIWTIPFALINYGMIYRKLATNNLVN
jgi:uncharacterized membrane protein